MPPTINIRALATNDSIKMNEGKLWWDFFFFFLLGGTTFYTCGAHSLVIQSTPRQEGTSCINYCLRTNPRFPSLWTGFPHFPKGLFYSLGMTHEIVIFVSIGPCVWLGPLVTELKPVVQCFAFISWLGNSSLWILNFNYSNGWEECFTRIWI